jgi:nickel-dependent lactate racemase
MTMKVKLLYGKSEVEIDVPNENLMAILEPKDTKPLYNVEDKIKDSLNSPVASEKIHDIVKPHMKVVIVCDDYTRKTPVHLILPYVLNELKNAGVKQENIKIIIALGTHRPATKKEIVEKIGKGVYEEYEVLNHNWENEEELANLGTTKNGTPIQINKHVMNSDFTIGIGTIVPHRVSGFSGGSKIIQPGVCGAATTSYTHWLSAQYSGEEILGKIKNSVRTEMDMVAEKAKLKFIVNVVLNRFGSISGVFAGDFREAYIQGAEFSRSIHGVEVPEKADIVICDCPHPTSIEMWQAAKSIYAADLIVKAGGTIILLTPCPEGVATEHPEVEQFGYKSHKEVEDLVKKGEIKDLTAAAHMIHVGRVIKEKAECILISEGIDEKTARNIGFNYASTLDEALKKALAKHGSKAKIAVARHTPDLLPIIKAR